MGKFKEIGSEFWLEDYTSENNCFSLFKNDILVFSGRTAIDIIAEDLLKRDVKNILLPSYLCDSMITPFINKDFKLAFYDVILEDDFYVANIEKIKPQKNTAILICDYYYFNKKKYFDLVEFARKLGCLIIHDITHSIFDESLITDYDDYYFASIRKWLPIPDGGIVGKRNEDFFLELKQPSEEFLNLKISAMKLKAEYINNYNSSKDEYLLKYKLSEDFFDSDYIDKSMSNESKMIINNFDFPTMIKKRKANARYLMENKYTNDRIKYIYKSDICTLFVPILFESREDRDCFRNYMTKKNIYLPVHWPRPDFNDPAIFKNDIYDRIISIVIDQRYGMDEMGIIVEEIECFLGGILNDKNNKY